MITQSRYLTIFYEIYSEDGGRIYVLYAGNRLSDSERLNSDSHNMNPSIKVKYYVADRSYSPD